MARLTRDQVATHLDRLHSELGLIVGEVDRLRRALMDTTRDYDQAPDEPHVIAERYGVDLEVAGEIPDWVRERVDAMLGER